MAALDTFRLATGPYIPREHEGLGLLPGRVASGGEVFSYPAELDVIDNEEFTSYLYPCDPDSWEIVLDPTGMAARALAGGAETVDVWNPELVADPESIEAWAAGIGANAKRTQQTNAFDVDADEGWNASEADPADFPCPGCGRTVHHDAWTLVNARQSPELAERLLAGTLFEFTCPECGYTASLASPCLYLDPTHRACVYLVVNEEMAKGVASMFADMDGEDSAIGRSVKRIVINRRELRDKAAALVAELDDRPLEILKTALTGQAKVQSLVPEGCDCEAYFEGIDEDGELTFEICIGETTVHASVPRGGYDLFASDLAKSSLVTEQPYTVDRTWAYHAVDVLQEEGIE